MVAKEISVKKYVVRLSADERELLEALIRKGKSPAQRLLKARILLKADVSEAGEGWSDSRIVAALESSPSMVSRVRKRLVEEGFDAVTGEFRMFAAAAGRPIPVSRSGSALSELQKIGRFPPKAGRDPGTSV